MSDVDCMVSDQTVIYRIVNWSKGDRIGDGNAQHGSGAGIRAAQAWRAGLSRIAQLDQRTALADQCLLSAEADVRPPRRKSGFGPEANME
jgi:hypothetical protein